MSLLARAVDGGTLTKLTLGKPTGRDPSLRNLFVRPVSLKSGPKLAFVWRHATRDITKNHDLGDCVALVGELLGTEFLDAHLFTTERQAQLETGADRARLKVTEAAAAPTPATGNDRQKNRPIAGDSPWLRALGITGPNGRPLAPMTDKFRQIERFAEILEHLSREAPLPSGRRLEVYDMGCGKGYLTFAMSQMLGERALVRGIELRPELVDFCNSASSLSGMAGQLDFEKGSISETQVARADILVALHACDTATDDALAKGIAAGAALLVVAPCCQKQVRPQLRAPEVLSSALRHGIFLERQAEFATDALRAQLLEWSGYRTRVFEFVSGEHTAKNTMISAVRTGPSNPSVAEDIRRFAAFYGIREHALATHLGFPLA